MTIRHKPESEDIMTSGNHKCDRCKEFEHENEILVEALARALEHRDEYDSRRRAAMEIVEEHRAELARVVALRDTDSEITEAAFKWACESDTVDGTQPNIELYSAIEKHPDYKGGD